MSIQVEVDKADMRALQFKMRNMMEKTPSRLKNAINRTGTQAVKMLASGTKGGYTYKKSVRKDLRIQKANPSHLDYTITASGKPHTLSKSFKTSTPKSGGKADVTKTGLKRLVSATGGAAFVTPAGKAAGLMAQRTEGKFPGTGNARFKVLYGNSVPKMVEKVYHGERGGQGDMEPEIQKILHAEIKKEIAKIK